MTETVTTLISQIRDQMRANGLRLTASALLAVTEGRVEAIGQFGEIVFTGVADADVMKIIAELEAQGILGSAEDPSATEEMTGWTSGPDTSADPGGGWLLVSSDTAMHCPGTATDAERDAALDAFVAVQPSREAASLVEKVLSGAAQMAAVAPDTGLLEFLREQPPPGEPAIAVPGESGYHWKTASSAGAVNPFRPAARLSTRATVCDDATMWTVVCAVAPIPGRRYSRDRIYAGAVAADLELATKKATGEAYERHTAGRISSADIRAASFDSLGADAMHPDQVIAYQPWQLDQNPQLATFDPAVQRLWVRCVDSSGSGIRWVLADLVFYPIGRPGALLHARANSSGMAAHPDSRLALRNAWLELLERDAFLRCWYARSSPPPIEVDLDLEEAGRLWADLSRQGWSVRLVDLSRIGQPIIGALVSNEDALVMGAAAMDSPRESAQKAILEAWSVLTARDDDEAPAPAEVQSPADHRRLYLGGGVTEHARFLLDSTETIPLSNLTQQLPGPGKRAAIYWWPTSITSPYHVVRILDPDRIPITFGYGSDPP